MSVQVESNAASAGDTRAALFLLPLFSPFPHSLIRSHPQKGLFAFVLGRASLTSSLSFIKHLLRSRILGFFIKLILFANLLPLILFFFVLFVLGLGCRCRFALLYTTRRVYYTAPSDNSCLENPHDAWPRQGGDAHLGASGGVGEAFTGGSDIKRCV